MSDPYEEQNAGLGAGWPPPGGVEPEAVAAQPEATVKVETVEQPEREAAPEPPPSAGYELQIPDDMSPAKIDEHVVARFKDFNAAAVASGIPQPVAEHMAQAFYDADILLGGYGKGEGAYTVSDAERVLRHAWGEEGYTAKMADVRATVKSLGSKFSDFLEQELEGGAQLGNDPRALYVLSQVADMKLSKKDAMAQLSALTDTKEYLKGDKSSVMRAKVLGRIVYAEGSPTTWTPRPAPNEVAAEKAAVSARQDAAAMLVDMNGPLRNAGHKDHAKAMAQYQALLAKA